MAPRIVAAAASLVVAAATNNATGPSPNEKCTLCKELVEVASGKVFAECDTLCKKTPIDAVCEKLCTLAQEKITPEEVCEAVHMCDSNGIPPSVVKEIEKLVCQAVKDEVPDDKFASVTCEELKTKIPILPEQTCEDVAKKIFDDTMNSCPKNLQFPIPPSVEKEIEKLVCQAVKDEVPEDKFASVTCEELKTKLPILPEQTCEDVAKKIYEDTIKSCPKSNQFPIPSSVRTEIEKLVCQAVKDEVPEDKFASVTCEELKTKLPILPEQACEDVAKEIYEDTIKSCPKSIVV